MGDSANNRAFGHLQLKLRRYSEAGVSAVERRIEQAKGVILGRNKDEVVQTLLFGTQDYKFNLKGIASKKLLDEAYDLAEQNPSDAGGAPIESVWGQVQGITRKAQEYAYADKRVEVDAIATKVLEIAVPV